MDKRPGLLDLRSHSHSSATSSTSKALRSPRMHIAGEAPPELSPLDAFALQSRLLAKQLQESNKEGNRMSRLPPLTMESPLVLQGRSDYFRSMSQDSLSEVESPEAATSPSFGHKTEIEDAFANDNRPMSMHPRMSRIPPTPNADVPAIPQNIPEMPRGRPGGSNTDAGDPFFGARRERSPSPLQSDTQSPARKDSFVSASSKQTAAYASSPEKSKQDSFDELGLVPPPSLFPKRSSSIFSASPVPGDDDSSSSLGGSFHSLPVGKSTEGIAAVANTMPSPAASSSFKRSPSTASESSALPRPSFNFSRPLSRAGTPSFDMPSRQASSDSQPSFILADESVQTPVSMHSEAFLDHQVDDVKTAAPSYIYSKFSLPRGKTIQRSEPSENASQATFQWEQQPVLPPSNVHRFPIGAPPSPPTRPSSSSARTVPDDAVSTVSSMARPSMDTSKASLDSSRLGASLSISRPSRPSVESSRKSEDAPRGRTLSSTAQDQGRGRTPVSAATSDSASTIRPPPTARSLANSQSEMAAEEHLAKGIECHENGSLNESTYHLRLAARQNNPTAMLLYALACRHGWGMRANQREGVAWLRKAVEYASVEIADDEDQVKDGRVVGNILERRTRKAQFALSIYELGVSHMNGWGIEQDKSLALRCFEIAGTWGDVDALAETGFCYAQGVGCKKDLKKSAKFYRMAEAKGMSMVGNSWIHKSKYNDDESLPNKDKMKKKSRSKSRTRTMFGLKSHQS